MPLLTVRLTDEEHAALKALAAGSSMADLIRGWIGYYNGSPAKPTKGRTVSSRVLEKIEFRPAPKPVRKR